MKKILEQLKEIGAERVFVQYPEGLKAKIQKIGKELEEEGFECVISSEPCFGACDIRDVEAKRLGCDIILHIGHSDFGIKPEIPVIYSDYFYDFDPLPILDKEIDKLEEFKSIGLVTSLQYVKVMERVKEYLEGIGKKIYLHKSLKYPGQILGCDVRAAKEIEKDVDCFLYVGTGKFHPLGVSLNVEVPVFSLDLERKEITDMKGEKTKYLKKKAWRDSELRDAKSVGIVVSWKRGQNRIDEAIELKKRLKNEGKEVHLIAIDEFKSEKLEGLKFDCLINLICPRMDVFSW